MNKNHQALGVLFALISSLSYGLSFIFTKSVVDHHSWLSLLGWRFLLAFSFMSLLGILGVVKLNFRGKSNKPLIPLVILCPILYFLGEILGVKYTTASESAILIATIPLATLLFSILFLKDRPSPWQFVGMVITLGGITLNVLNKSGSASFHPFGYLMLLMAVSSYAYYAVLYIKVTDFSTAEKTYALMVSGFLFFFPAALVESLLTHQTAVFFRLPLQRDFLTAILFLGIVSSVLAFLCSNASIKYLGASRAASFAGLTTLTTITAGVFFLKEQFSLVQIFAAALILGGVYLTNRNH